jgi:hypothetical protein
VKKYLILFLFAVPVWAQEQPERFETATAEVSAEFDMEEMELPPIKEKFRFKNRTVELSVANISFDFANNFITAADVFNSPFFLLKNIKDIIADPVLIYRDPVEINLDNFFNGFKLNFGAEIKPLSLNFNYKDRWGIGLDIAHIKVEGNQSFAGDVFAFNKIEKEKSGVGGAVFVDVGIPVFFHINKFKIKIRPSAYVPLVYTEPNISFASREGTKLKINYNMYVYSLVDMGGLQDDGVDPLIQDLQDNYMGILKNNLGYDFRLGVEYPWYQWLDVGVDIVNIPLSAASLNHYMQIKGSMSIEIDEIDVNTVQDHDFWNEAYTFESDDPVTGYDSSGKKIYRPFKMLFYANYRPFNSQTLTLIPSLGFSINYFYLKPATIEGGLSVCLDLANIFITTLGVNYNDRKWKNSLDLVFNLRAFELDLGLAIEGQNFRQSWQGAGLGINFGLKLGW